MSVDNKTATNVKQAVPFFSVSNIEESVRYYVDGLGFQMTESWTPEGKLRWCSLQHGGAALVALPVERGEHGVEGLNQRCWRSLIASLDTGEQLLRQRTCGDL